MKIFLYSNELIHSSCVCVAEIEKALNAVDGVQETKVHFNSGHIEVTYDPEKTSCDRLVQALHSAGYKSKVTLPKLFRPASRQSPHDASSLEDL